MISLIERADAERIAGFFSDPMEDLILTYRGPLPSGQSGDAAQRKRIQFAMRRDFHYQLKAVWNRWPFLKDAVAAGVFNTEASPSWHRHPRHPFSFVPLVITGTYLKLICELKMKLLSRDAPGSIVHNGDLDNRIKVLFDALCIPQNNQLPNGVRPTADEDPFFCLLEDDKLITSLSVDTKALLRPAASDDHTNHVELDITVSIKKSDQNTAALRLD